MKNSNKLIILFLALLLLTLLGSNLAIKAEFDRMSLKDRFYGYKNESVKPFKVLVLKGNLHGFIEILPGNSNIVRTNKLFEQYAHQKTYGDTLEISFIKEVRNGRPDFDFNGYGQTIIVETPKLPEVLITDISCRIKGWKSSELKLRSSGGVTRLDSNIFTSVTALYTHGAYLQVAKSNALGNTSVQIKDSSQFVVKQNVFNVLDIKADSTAFVSLPGNLLYKLMKK